MTDSILSKKLNIWKEKMESEKITSFKSLFMPSTLKDKKIKSINNNSWFVVVAKVQKKNIFEYDGEKHWNIKLDKILVAFDIEEEEFNKSLIGDNYILIFHQKAKSTSGKYDLKDVILRFPNEEYSGTKIKH